MRQPDAANNNTAAAAAALLQCSACAYSMDKQQP
jgi:hypothetical protein